jgi:hypothetical protein
MIFAAIVVPIVVALAIVLLAGWWRFALRVFAIPARDMTVARLGLRVPAGDVARVDGILGSFAGGFNAALVSPSPQAWERYCDARPALLRPFAQEGAAMGYTPRRRLRFDAADFARRVVGRHPGYRYLHHVGVGFWAGLRRYTPAQLAHLVAELDPLYRYLCYDGYGFKHEFFDHAKELAGLRPLDALQDYARHAAYQGVGRAMFFRFMGDPALLNERLRELGVHAADAAGGVGLAAVFVFPDRLEVARELAASLPPEWHAAMQVGMCFGLKARSINDPDQFERDLAGAPAGVQAAVRAAISACDRIETEVRAEGVPAAAGYRLWRERVGAWMTERIVYPLTALRESAADRGQGDRAEQPAGVGDDG